MILVRSGPLRACNYPYHSYSVFRFGFTPSAVNLVLLVLCLLPCSLSCSPSERDSLLAFLSNLSGTSIPKGATFPSWNVGGNSDCCRWDGVACDGLGSVTHLWLPLRGLKGPISATALLGLPSLIHLNLSRNSLSGGLDPSLPWKAGLVVLDVSFNRLDGRLVMTGQQLPTPAESLRLQTVDLSSNRFTGPLLPSAWWANAPDLVAVNTSNNLFSGSIPSSICAAKRLQAVDISFNQLDGSIPLGFANCTQLTLLRMGYNHLAGQVPSDLYNAVSLHELSVPSNKIFGNLDTQGKIANLANLSLLDFGYNQMTGSVPENIGELANLEVLMLNNNQFSGSLPSTLSNCTKLRYLNLRDNVLSGMLSAVDFSKLPNLQTLDLGFNSFTGQVPSDLYNAVSLHELSVPSNKIFGNLDTQGKIANLANLSLLDFGYNQMTGSVPESIGELANLEVLMLNNNQFSGSLPSTLSNCTKLRYLNLRYNVLSGMLSAVDFSKLPNLQTLDLGFNSFTGTVPPSLYSCKSLVALRLAKNQISGRIGPGLAGLQVLSFISLSQNKIIGINRTFNILQKIKSLRVVLLDRNFYGESMPQDVAGFANLQLFSLARSNLTGQVPSWLSSLSMLAFIDLSSNQLTGTIPLWLGSLPHLFSLDLSNNLLSGEFPVQLTALSALTSEQIAAEVQLPVFDNSYQYNGLVLPHNQLYSLPPTLNLQQNKLTGVIPPEIGLLNIFLVLNLSRNSFSGTIPSEIGNLTHLESLDLSYNRLQGRIPGELTNLRSLSKFSVAHNELSGPIPQGSQFSTFNFFSFEGNPGLCGEDMSALMPCTDYTELSAGQSSIRKHFDEEFLAGFIIGVSFGGAFVLLTLFLMPSRKTKHTEMSVSPEAGIISNWSTPSFPQYDEIISCGQVVLFQENCQMKNMTIAELMHATNNLDKDNIIGCGSVGIVYKCALPDGTKLAVKRLTGDTGIVDRVFRTEMKAISTARDENLVSLLGYFMHRNFRLLIYSLMENGSLWYWLHEKPNGPLVLKWPLRLLIAQGVSRGLSYIHLTRKPHRVHGNIKSSNILLDHNLKAQIADFGLSRLMLLPDAHITPESFGRPLRYIPPEYGQAWAATLKEDIYSFGLVLFELLTGRRPYVSFDRNQSRKLVRWVLEMRNLDKQEEVFDPVLRGHGNEEQMIMVLHIACLCVIPDPLERPAIQDVTDWLHDVDTTKA